MKQPIPTVMLDVNVILDALLDREPWAGAALSLLSLCDQKRIHGYWCADSISTIAYLLRKHSGSALTRRSLHDLQSILRVAPVNEQVITAALSSTISDVEDAIVYESARLVGATHLVTRDPGGFRHASLIVCSPESLLGTLP